MGSPRSFASWGQLVERIARTVAPSAILAVVPMLVLFAWTDQRDVQFWDVGEMQTVPWIFGIAHPTGFPLYTIGGWAFAHALPFGTVAWRMSFFSSVAVCATGYFAYRLVLEETRLAWPAAACAVAFDATSIAWSRGTRADVHPLAVCFEAAAVYAMFRWRRSRQGASFIAAFALLGCGLAVHPVALFAIPALVALGLSAPPRLRIAAFAGVAFLVPFLAYAYLPIRSAELYAARRDPTLALGLPPGNPFWDYAHTAEPQNFLCFVSGAQFHREAGALGYLDGAVFLKALAFAGAIVAREFGWPLVLLALVGFAVTCAKAPARGIALVLLALCVVPFAFAYAEEADRERYLLVTLFATACAIGLGAAALVRFAARYEKQRLAVALTSAFVAILGAFHVYQNRNVIAIDRDTVARRYVETIRSRTPADAIVIADWVYLTPLAYAAYVENRLDERTIVAGPLRVLLSRVSAWSRQRCVVYVSDGPRPVPLGRGFRSQRLTSVVPFVFEVDDDRTSARPTSPCRASAD